MHEHEAYRDMTQDKQAAVYADLGAALADLVHEHPLPMAMFDRDLRALGFSRNLLAMLPDAGAVKPGDPLDTVIAALGTEGDGPIVTPDDITVNLPGTLPRGMAEAIRRGEWRLDHVVTHSGRVVVPFNYPLASGNTQLVLLEPAMMNEVTDLSEVLDVAADAFAIFDENQRLIRCNSQFVALLTYDPTSPQPLGQTASEIVRKVVTEGTLLVAEGLDHAQMIEAMVAGLLTPAGATFEVEGKLGRIFLASTKPRSSGGHILTLRDITDLRKGERQAVTTMRDAIGALDQGFAYYDEALNLQIWNEQYDRMYCGDCGLHPKLGEDGVAFLRRVMEAGRFILPDGSSVDDYVAEIVRKVERGEHTEYNFSDGTSVLCSYNVTSSGGLLVTLMDVTDKRASEHRALTTLRDAVGALEEGFFLLDEDLNFVLCNDRYRTLVFKDPDFYPCPGQSGAEIVAMASRSTQFHRPDGMSEEDWAAHSFQALLELPKHAEVLLDNGKMVEFSIHRTVQRGYLITALDVTERHEAAAEIERQAQIAHQNEKLSALGELLAGVAHELNNPLSIVLGYSQMLANELTEPKQADRIRRVTLAAERSAKIVKTFLAMARQRPARMEPVDLADVIETAVDVAAYGLRTAGGRLTVNCDPRLPPVMADKDQMIQVFSNLIVNAEHAMRGMGSDAHLALKAACKGRDVEIAISDNGTGMDAQTTARVFDPFFTTKQSGEGTGFGLAFCHRIVTSHSGTLTVQSRPGKGSQFSIVLPAIELVESTSAEGMRAIGSGLSILVVDEERDVVDLIGEVLEVQGHAIVRAYSPAEALTEIEARAFDIVLSDMKMPDMNGDRLLAEILARRPAMAGRVGFVTGDSLSEKVRDFLEDGRQHFIEKPVVIEELLDLVERIRPNGYRGMR